MNVNKKLDRFKQWAGERMGGEVKTSVSDDFKALETEMQLKFEGMERLHKSMTLYIKNMSKRNEAEDKEKALPVGHLGSTMINHGDDFAPDSEIGACFTGLGRANERIARMQETYVADAKSTWLESIERSLAQMKDYQAARKKLETRRLAYDTTLAKMQKAKKEDFRVEEELRSQKAKYEESSEDVFRRMQDIKEAEVDTVADLTSFLEAELTYYDRCREVLVQLRRDWPATKPTGDTYENRRGQRSRSDTNGSYSGVFNPDEDEPLPHPRLRVSKISSRGSSPWRDTSGGEALPALPARPQMSRSTTSEGYSRNHRDFSPASMPRLSRVPTEPAVLLANRSQLRPVKRAGINTDVFGDPSDESTQHESSSPDRYFEERSASPATSYGSTPSRNASWSALETNVVGGAKKAPPPPPPSRSKKPPPPPPMKRSALSTSEIPRT